MILVSGGSIKVNRGSVSAARPTHTRRRQGLKKTLYIDTLISNMHGEEQDDNGRVVAEDEPAIIRKLREYQQRFPGGRFQLADVPARREEEQLESV